MQKSTRWFGTMSVSLLTTLVVGTTSFAQSRTEGAKSGPSDPEIAHIVVTANTIDVDAGKMAGDKTKNKEVKAFAKQMVTDHTAVNKQATELAEKLGVTPKDNATSQALKQDGEKSQDQLKDLSGKKFDQQYVAHEVAYHETVLKALDDTLIPSAQNAELKALLKKVRPAFVAHLDHAKMLDKKLNGKKSSN